MDNSDIEDSEYCRRCSTVIHSFSKKYAISTGEYYCVKCAERVDSEYLIKNSCSVCTRLLSASEPRFVLPSKTYGDAPLALSERLVCAECHDHLANKTLDRRGFSFRVGQIRSAIRKSISKKLIDENSTDIKN